MKTPADALTACPSGDPGIRPDPASINPAIAGLPISATLAINERSAHLETAGLEICRLGLGQSPFPVPDRVAAALREHAHEKAYLPVRGLPELREEIAAYHARLQSLKFASDRILIGPGTKELMFLLQLVYTGEVVIPAPGWVSYAPQARIAGREVRWLRTEPRDGFCLTADMLERHCRTRGRVRRLLILNYPHNPTGTSYAPGELEAIADVARRHRILILSDEIYSGLQFDGRHVSIARYYPEGTIVSDGLSKWCGAGGWRLGSFAFPDSLEWLAQPLAVAASETFTSVSAPIQYAAVQAFHGGPDIDAYLRDSRRIAGSLMRQIAARLRETGAAVCEPTGAFYVFPDLTGTEIRARRPDQARSARLLCEQLLEDTGVALLPGGDFGRPDEELTVRLAGVDFDGHRALAAAAALPPDSPLPDAFLDEFCAPTLVGVDRLCAWLTGG